MKISKFIDSSVLIGSSLLVVLGGAYALTTIIASHSHHSGLVDIYEQRERVILAGRSIRAVVHGFMPRIPLESPDVEWRQTISGSDVVVVVGVELSFHVSSFRQFARITHAIADTIHRLGFFLGFAQNHWYMIIISFFHPHTRFYSIFFEAFLCFFSPLPLAK